MKNLKNIAAQAFGVVVYPLLEAWPVVLCVGLAFALAKN